MEIYKENKIDSELVFKGKVITVTKDTVKIENGNIATREVVHHNGGSSIVAINKNCEIALVKQYRYALDKVLIEIPAGKIEIGESPYSTALRELEEEAGLKANNLIEFGSVIPTCGYCTEIIYIYLATNLEDIGTQNLDEDEFVEPFWIPLKQAVDLVLSGEITDSKTVSGILRAYAGINSGEIQF